jgi:hypothetical protein
MLNDVSAGDFGHLFIAQNMIEMSMGIDNVLCNPFIPF